MNLLCASSGIVNMNNPQKGICSVSEVGFENILLDLSLCCTSIELENIGKKKPDIKKDNRLEVFEYPEKIHETMMPLLKQCRAQGLNTQVAYAPYLDRDTKHADLNKLLFRLAKESIKLCGQAGCRHLIVKPLFAGIAHYDEWEVNRRYYLELADIAKENNVIILLENQCRDKNGHLVRGICSDADEAVTWIDSLNEEVGEERFGFCMDVGACNLCGQDMQDFAIALGSRIKAVILRDCDGHQETSMLPFTSVSHGQSQTDWLGLIRGLREICFDGALIMDFSSTAAAFSQLLRPQLFRLAKATADYFKWQIGMKKVLKNYNRRVLFGAGNMCRNYMKCYGEEFPPLFTCDNNKNRWGEQFAGLEIKPPEALKGLDADCAIFICNIYYKEIEEQLRRMGICNPIEYFNDEYMPSYYFDRLDYWEGEGQ